MTLTVKTVPSSGESQTPQTRKRARDEPSDDFDQNVSDDTTIEIGSHCEFKTLYEGPPGSCSCCKTWVEEYPTDLHNDIQELDETKRKAIVVRIRKGHSDGKPLELDSIVVQNQSLKTTLSELFKGYNGITASLSKLVFRSPFHPFHYRWTKFGAILKRQKEQDPVAAAYTQLLYDVLKKELGDTRAEVDDLLRNGVITFRHLWALFEPGIRVFGVVGGHERIYVVDSHSFQCTVLGGSELSLSAKFVTWNEQQFVYAPVTHSIPAFPGTKSITDLEMFPTSFLTSKEEVEARIIARGKRFWELRGFQYRAYTGTVRCVRPLADFHMDGRIIIDETSYQNSDPTAKHKPNAPRTNMPVGKSDATVPTLDTEESRHPKKPRTSGYSSTAKPPTGTAELKHDPFFDVETLTDDQLLLCSPVVKGYSLNLNRWGLFAVDNVKPIAWNDDAFPNLRLPTGYKSLITAFVEGQTSSTDNFDDIIAGKGKGVIMLLVGNPGTGKTLTAEAVADKVRRPLYILNAGELGQDASDIDTRLKSILQLAEKWNAVLLFDECDVFLAQRRTSDFERNEVVAVFLRLLEYFRGILLMTTNRGEDIDRAFHSRIHLTLQYPDLDAAAKEHIWRHFVGGRIAAAGGSDLSDEQYTSLSKLKMNGRQIKNTVKIATLLASQEGTCGLNLHHLVSVLKATGYTNEVDLAFKD